VAGALAERDFVEKLRASGFIDVEVVNRSPFGIGDAEIYPLFTDDLRRADAQADTAGEAGPDRDLDSGHRAGSLGPGSAISVLLERCPAFGPSHSSFYLDLCQSRAGGNSAV
jgi:hypothetical protein